MRISEARPLLQGYAYVFLAAALWALSGAVSKYLFFGGVAPLQLVQLRTTIACSSLLLWLVVGRRRILAVERKDLPYFLLLGLILAFAQFTYLFAISRIHVAAAILLQYQSPVIIATYGFLFGGRSLSSNTLIAIFGAVGGCYLMVGAYNVDLIAMNRAGIVSGLASAAGFAWYTMKSECGMRSYGPWTVLFYALFFAALACNIVLPPLAAFAGGYTIRLWCGIAFIGIIGTIFPFGFYNKGIRIIRSTRASITATIEPVFAGVAAYFLVGEAMGPMQMAGAMLVISSILLLQIRQDPA
ncbi:MAG: EamA family transporter [Nitrospiraceae bacterium]|nr:EamA family transporter [Nitrospiraceae bacterium]